MWLYYLKGHPQRLLPRQPDTQHKRDRQNHDTEHRAGDDLSSTVRALPASPTPGGDPHPLALLRRLNIFDADARRPLIGAKLPLPNANQQIGRPQGNDSANLPLPDFAVQMVQVTESKPPGIIDALLCKVGHERGPVGLVRDNHAGSLALILSIHRATP